MPFWCENGFSLKNWRWKQFSRSIEATFLFLKTLIKFVQYFLFKNLKKWLHNPIIVCNRGKWLKKLRYSKTSWKMDLKRQNEITRILRISNWHYQRMLPKITQVILSVLRLISKSASMALSPSEASILAIRRWKRWMINLVKNEGIIYRDINFDRNRHSFRSSF